MKWDYPTIHTGHPVKAMLREHRTCHGCLRKEALTVILTIASGVRYYDITNSFLKWGPGSNPYRDLSCLLGPLKLGPEKIVLWFL